MGIKFKYILLIIFQSVLINQYAFTQQDKTVCNSFVHSDFTSIERDKGYAVSAIEGTKDSGFIYLVRFPNCAIDSSFTKFIISRGLYDTCCIEKPSFRINNGRKTSIYLFARSLLIKADKNGNIQWAKSVFNEDYPANGGYFSLLKQTSDYGFITSAPGRIIKLDSIGNITWKLYFNRDSIPLIKKSMFLSQTGISDIYECKDGSFIALMSAGFSLLKISKDGKPLWLKSTVFDEFNILYTRAWSDKYILNKSDTFYIENYKNGGGIYIPTYNVYETDDGGYMAIGNNRYSYKPFLTKLCEGSDCDKKAFFYHSTGKDGNEIKSFIHPDRVYVYREYTLNDEEKPQIQKRSTTVVVKTDKNGNVLWKRQFGNMSYDTHPHSDLVKLAGGKWLVRIRDCSDMGTKDVYGNINWGSPHPEFFLLDNNGNILKRPHFGPSKYICDPMGMALAPDSTYYFYEQDVVSKTDTKMRIQWQRGFGGWLTDYGIHAVTADNGILSTERGIIYKFDPYGNLPQDTIGIDISKAILPRDNTGKTKSYAHISFYAPAVTELTNVVIEPKDASKIKDEDIICYSYIIEDHSFDSREENALENKKKYLKSGKTEKKYKMPWYMFISEINVGKYDPSLNSYTLDLNDTCQLRGMFCEQKQDTLPAVMVNIPYLYGYREVYLGDLAPGNYVCKITIMLSNKENKTWQKEFTWKP